MPTASARPVRADNRVGDVLDVAARCFAQRGYAAATMREIADGAGMLPGSLYYHFASKEALLVAVYEAGVHELETAFQQATARHQEPWARLEAGCIAHLETLLQRQDYAQVLIRVLPDDVPAAAQGLRELRARYEALWQQSVRALPLAAGTDRETLRLMLLGALNWTCFWYAPGGRDTPRSLARKYIKFLEETPHA